MRNVQKLLLIHNLWLWTAMCKIIRYLYIQCIGDSCWGATIKYCWLVMWWQNADLLMECANFAMRIILGLEDGARRWIYFVQNWRFREKWRFCAIQNALKNVQIYLFCRFEVGFSLYYVKWLNKICYLCNALREIYITEC